MTRDLQPEPALRQWVAQQRDDVRAVHQLAKETRAMVEETRRLLADPMWLRMASACPGR